jgi:hypothetical protein
MEQKIPGCRKRRMGRIHQGLGAAPGATPAMVTALRAGTPRPETILATRKGTVCSPWVTLKRLSISHIAPCMK